MEPRLSILAAHAANMSQRVGRYGVCDFIAL